MARTNREFVMLAKPFDRAKHRIGGMYVSEKLDGMRATWIPAARGKPVDTLPFANIEKDKKLSVCTGLFSRYGKIIYAPKYFLDSLPTDRCLDGELWMGRQSFQKTMSAVKKHEPILDEWAKVKFYVFDTPAYSVLFQDGKINNPNFKKQINMKQCLDALEVKPEEEGTSFEFARSILEKESKSWNPEVLTFHQQELLPFKTDAAFARLDEIFREVTDDGGEGLMIRHPAWSWEPLRSDWLFKYKPEKDAEARVIGYVAGKGKHQARLGSLRCMFGDTQFDVGGFTDEERILTPAGQVWADANPGDITNDPISLQFPVGSVITFAYRELTDAGVPKEARYRRVKLAE